VPFLSALASRVSPAPPAPVPQLPLTPQLPQLPPPQYPSAQQVALGVYSGLAPLGMLAGAVAVHRGPGLLDGRQGTRVGVWRGDALRVIQEAGGVTASRDQAQLRREASYYLAATAGDVILRRHASRRRMRRWGT
jgi:hypothetical protein